MEISMTLNGRKIKASIEATTLLLDFLRQQKCYSVKRGCETTNCGLCTVILDGKPVLSCSILAARCDGAKVETLEGLLEEASAFTGFLADQGADQCGFCNPGYVVNFVALLRENPHPTDEEIDHYLAGNLCRCTGFESQRRAFRNFLNYRDQKEAQ